MNIEAFIEHLEGGCKKLSEMYSASNLVQRQEMSYYAGREDGYTERLKDDVQFLYEQLSGDAAETINVEAACTALRKIIRQYRKQTSIVACFAPFLDDTFFASAIAA